MGIIIRQSIKSSVIVMIGVVIGTINTLLLYNEFLTSDQLGLYTALNSFSIVFTSFATLGTPHVGVRFFSFFADEKRKHNGFFGYLLLTPLIGFGLFLLLYLSAQGIFRDVYLEESPLLVNYFYTPVFLTLFLIYIIVLETYARVHHRIVVPAVIREIFLKLSNSLVVVLFALNWIDFDQLIRGIIISHFAACCLLVGYIAKLGKLYLTFDFSFLKKPVFSQMWKYGLWTVMGGAAATFVPHIEKIFLPAFENGLTQTAIFNIALSIGTVITVPRNALASISDPIIAKAWAENDLTVIGRLYQKTALNSLIVGLFMFLGIWCNIDSIFHLIPNTDIYIQGKTVVLLVCTYNLFDMAMGPNSEILKNSPYYRYDFSFFIARVLILIISNLLLIPRFGIDGAASAMLGSVIVYNLIKYLFIYYKTGLQHFTHQTWKVLAIGLAAWLLAAIIPQLGFDLTSAAVTIVLRSLVITAVFGGGILWLKVSPDINQTLTDFRKNGLGFLFGRER